MGEIATRALRAMGPSGVQALGRLLGDDSERIRIEAATALRPIEEGGGVAVPFVVAALKREFEEEKEKEKETGSSLQSHFMLLFEVLENLAPHAVPELVKSLEGEVPKIRFAIAMALATTPEGKPPALNVLKEFIANKEWDHRSAALCGIGGELGPMAIPVLLEGLHDFDRTVRCASSSTLGDMGNAAAPAIPALVGSLADEIEQVRINSVRALVAVGVPAIPALIAAFDHGELLVRENAVIAITGLAESNAKTREAARAAIPALVALGDAAPAGSVLRRETETALSRLADERSMQSLLQKQE